MHAFEVHIRAKDLAAFRRRVLYAYKKRPEHEYMEAIFVKLGVGEYHICSFHKLHLLETSPTIVSCSDEEYASLKAKAEALGLSLGSIHTHTMNDSAPSKHDHVSASDLKDCLLGVCEVTKSEAGVMHTKLDFWVPILPCVIKQVRD